ncbi:hypothetical protein A3K63_02210 [Candidatus Micrarchaeota archaeon RBG_16_49_10]|nr:MAG: hypothetical protein A3K63_02210 [Candidatus Micrarchaeota archaeon RBG_16_49_10]
MFLTATQPLYAHPYRNLGPDPFAARLRISMERLKEAGSISSYSILEDEGEASIGVDITLTPEQTGLSEPWRNDLQKNYRLS